MREEIKMKKKVVLLSSLMLTGGIIVSSIAFLPKSDLSVKAGDTISHQIVLTAEDTTYEKEETYTAYFSLHQDDATWHGWPIDSKPNECLIMADGNRGAGGDQICFGEANPISEAYASLYVTIPLTNIESFTSVVFRGRFYRDYYSDLVTEISFGSESYSAIWHEFSVHLFKQYKVIFLDEIEINYTCAL